MGGSGWKIRVDGHELWPWREPWKAEVRLIGEGEAVIEAVVTHPGLPIRVTERVCVAHDRDCLVSRIRVEGIDSIPEFVWYDGFAPTELRIPGIPVADNLWETRGFAAFLVPDAGMAISFRPRQPGAQEWETARVLVQGNDFRPRLEQWARFGKGCWIASSSIGRAKELSFAHDRHSAAIGTPASVLVLDAVPEDKGYCASVAIGFGDDMKVAMDGCEEIRRLGVAAIETAADAYWIQWIEKAALPDKLDEATCRSLREDLLSMARSMDRNTGAVVGMAQRSLFDPLDWPREGVFVAGAFDLAGFAESAERQMAFYDRCMRKNEDQGRPGGSWPAACYWDATEGLPDTILDPGVNAWILGAFWRHAQRLPETQRKTFLELRWSCIEAAVDFVVGWVDARNREPLSGFDAARWRDSVNDTMLLEHFMCVDAGLRMAATLGKTPNDGWGSRKRELEALIRFHCVAKGGQWTSSATLPFWQDEFRETALPSWEKVIEERVFALEGDVKPTALDVCNAALAFRGKPESLYALKSLIPEPKRYGDAAAYVSALHFITIATIYGETK